MKYPIGSKVKVNSTIETANKVVTQIEDNDETISKEFKGMNGIIESYNENGMTGNTIDDPLYVVKFAENLYETFWHEELSILNF